MGLKLDHVSKSGHRVKLVIHSIDILLLYMASAKICLDLLENIWQPVKFGIILYLPANVMKFMCRVYCTHKPVF